ncbi:EpsG family protein [Clostridium frigoris]|uniref:EpsG family protein n=1 Tax=Clostridium frigoris TaxID=205327 RepID=A0ABS6BTL2_9CLOT|nr:EpsG family protein [Clostridium frigoris]MBU3159855.1 EpsG family protein [Clostridium frigoris]
MIFYFSWFIITFLLVVFKKEESNKNIIFVFILFTLVYGCRNYGGVDDMAYISAFNNTVNGNIVYGIKDESFLVISRIIGALGFNYKAVFLLYASISFTFVYLAYRELCYNKYEWIVAILGFLVFCFLPTITVMRQFVAASIIIYAFTLKQKNKNKLSLIFIALACIFHLGAVIGFVLFPLFSIKFKTKTKVIVPLVCLGIGYLGFFAAILNNLVFLIPTSYLGYLDEYANTEPRIGIVHIILISTYLIQFVLLNINKTNNPSDKTVDFLERGQMIYFSLFFITLSSGWMSRLSIYFLLFTPFIFKTFIARFSLIKDKKILYGVCYVAFLLLFMYQIINIPYSTNMNKIIPYNGSFDFMR